MWVIRIDGNDHSIHTLEIDADAQKTRRENAGDINVIKVETDTFSPPEN